MAGMAPNLKNAPDDTARASVAEAQEMLRAVLEYSETLLEQMRALNEALKALPTARAGVITEVDEETIN